MKVFTLDDVFELFEGESLLDGLLRQGYAAEYQCRSGFCGTCKLKYTTGAVEYKEQPIAFLNVGEVLPCCCVLKEPITVEIERQTPLHDPFSGELHP